MAYDHVGQHRKPNRQHGWPTVRCCQRRETVFLGFVLGATLGGLVAAAALVTAPVDAHFTAGQQHSPPPPVVAPTLRVPAQPLQPLWVPQLAVSVTHPPRVSRGRLAGKDDGERARARSSADLPRSSSSPHHARPESDHPDQESHASDHVGRHRAPDHPSSERGSDAGHHRPAGNDHGSVSHDHHGSSDGHQHQHGGSQRGGSSGGGHQHGGEGSHGHG